jgi:hypothetical protein
MIEVGVFFELDSCGVDFFEVEFGVAFDFGVDFGCLAGGGLMTLSTEVS